MTRELDTILLSRRPSGDGHIDSGLASVDVRAGRTMRPAGGATITRSRATVHPRTIVRSIRPRRLRQRKGLRRWRDNSSPLRSTSSEARSTMTRSASAPGAIDPFPRRSNRRAGAADASVAIASSASPRGGPSESRILSSVCPPAIPPQAANASSPCFSSGGLGEWSDPIRSTCPSRTVSQRSSTSFSRTDRGRALRDHPDPDRVVLVECEVVRARLARDVDAAGAGLHDEPHRPPAREVDDVK